MCSPRSSAERIIRQPARRRRFHPLTAQPPPQQLGPYLFRALLGDGDVLDQPLDPGVLVREGALPKPEQRAQLGAVPLELRGRHPQLTGDEPDRLVRHLRAFPGESGVLQEELPQHREREPVHPALRAAAPQLLTDQRPPLDQLVLVQPPGHARQAIDRHVQREWRPATRSLIPSYVGVSAESGG